MDGCSDKWMKLWIDGCKYSLVYWWINRWKVEFDDSLMAGWMGGQMYEWLNKLMDVWVDKWMHGRITV